MGTNAVILAAGMGTRLRPATLSLPKSLVPVLGHPILAWEVAALRAAGVSDVVVVTGYRSDLVAPVARALGVRSVRNPAYQVSNNIVSLLVGASCVHEAETVVVMNGDIVCTSDLVSTVLKQTGATVGYFPGKHDPEAMGLTVTSGRVVAFGKGTPPERGGPSSDVYKFPAGDFETLVGVAARLVFTEGRSADWFESALQAAVAGDIALTPVDVSGHAWAEIDTRLDLRQAETEFRALTNRLDEMNPLARVEDWQ